MDSRCGSLQTRILSLASKLASPSIEEQKEGARELRVLSRTDPGSRIAIAESGTLPLLLKLLSSPDEKVQENAVTTLLNVSISEANKALIMKESPASVGSILHVLASSLSMEAKENSAALLFSLMVEEAHRPVIGQHHGLIQALLNLLRCGSALAKKDALKALFHIGACAENRPFLIKAGTVPVLLSLLLQSRSGLVEDALAVLAQSAGCAESVDAFIKSSAVPLIADLLDTGSSRARENAASTLLNFCKAGGKAAVEEVLEVESCSSSLYSLLISGSSRGKSKASALLQILVINDKRT